MSNGGRYFNEEYGGEVYYDTPSMLGALTFVDDLVHKHKVMPPGVTKGRGVSTAFLAGKASMMLLSTGSLTFIRENTKFAYKVAFVPTNVRNAVPIGGASLVMPRGWSEAQQQGRLDADQVADLDREVRLVEPRHRLFRAEQVAPTTLPEMKEFLAKNPDAKVAVDQLALRQAVVRDLQDRRRAQGDGGRDAGGALRQEEAEGGGQGRAEEGRRDDAALCRADRAEAAVTE